MTLFSGEKWAICCSGIFLLPGIEPLAISHASLTSTIKKRLLFCMSFNSAWGEILRLGQSTLPCVLSTHAVSADWQCAVTHDALFSNFIFFVTDDKASKVKRNPESISPIDNTIFTTSLAASVPMIP